MKRKDRIILKTAMATLLLIALSPFTAGINFNGGAALILANLFLTLGIGMAEEIFFRGIICGLWLERGVGKAMIISSVLFGFSHLLNIAGGAELGETVLQICFALVYGMVFALIFAESGSLLPCVLPHALHDFCSFISGEASAQFEIFLGAVQFIVLLVYFLYLFRITARKKGTGFERQVKTDEKISNHVLCGRSDQPACGTVAFYRTMDVWLGFVYTV